MSSSKLVNGMNLIGGRLGGIKNKTSLFGWLIVALIIALIVGQIIYYGKMQDSKCNAIARNFQSTKLASFTASNKDFQDNLNNYYIKSAYNCCAISGFSNTYVDLCALNNVLKSGVRFLDFEIYSVNGKQPVVAVSNMDNNNIKQSLNHLKFDDVMEEINQNAFTGASGCPNPEDPIFLHFRVKSDHKEVYNNMAKIIRSKFDTQHQLLGKEFSNAFNGYNLGKIPLHCLSKKGKFDKVINKKAKIVIIIDRSNTTYIDTNMKEFVNMESGGNFINLKQDFHIKTDENKKGLIEQNKHSITTVIPDKIPEGGGIGSLHCCVPGSKNPDFRRNFEVGCQIVCMCFQNVDTYLKNYNKFFNDSGTAFVLKPEPLRFKPVKVKKPEPQKAENSFATREVKEDYYSFEI